MKDIINDFIDEYAKSLEEDYEKIKKMIRAKEVSDFLSYGENDFAKIQKGEQAAILQEGSIMIKLCDGFYYSLNDIKFQLIKEGDI